MQITAAGDMRERAVRLTLGNERRDALDEVAAYFQTTIEAVLDWHHGDGRWDAREHGRVVVALRAQQDDRGRTGLPLGEELEVRCQRAAPIDANAIGLAPGELLRTGIDE